MTAGDRLVAGLEKLQTLGKGGSFSDVPAEVWTFLAIGCGFSFALLFRLIDVNQRRVVAELRNGSRLKSRGVPKERAEQIVAELTSPG